MLQTAVRGCLAHPCMEVGPKDAISLDRTTGKSIIDQEKCIKVWSLCKRMFI